MPESLKLEPLDSNARRERAKERLYVLAQSAGWVGLGLLQVFLIELAKKGNAAKDVPEHVYSLILFTLLTGLLLSHFLRPLIARFGWKKLDWRLLIPRVLLLAFATSAIWSGLTHAFMHGLLNEPWRDRPAIGFVFSVVNGSVFMVGWLCLYFFYHLFDRFNRLEIERLRLQTSVKEAELRALKSQINPHFIFNSLNSLRALIDENPTRARSAVTQLANLLRYSLQSGQLETVSLDDELRVVKDYLALEQVRHEDRLGVRFDVSPEAGAMNVPPMLVQTLVENAVKYGIAPRREGGEIVIAARADRSGLRLRVSNPGSINRAQSPGSTAMGLKNAAERLQLLFGDQARLALREESPGLVVAEVEVPLETRRNEAGFPAVADAATARSSSVLRP